MWFSRRHNKLAVASLVLYAGTLVAAVTWFILNQISRAEIEEARRADAIAIASGQRYTGTVVLPLNAAGLCRHLDFDNITGALRERATSACSEETVAGNSTLGRMTAIRDSFARR
jgi:hypothetical protein